MGKKTLMDILEEAQRAEAQEVWFQGNLFWIRQARRWKRGGTLVSPMEFWSEVIPPDQQEGLKSGALLSGTGRMILGTLSPGLQRGGSEGSSDSDPSAWIPRSIFYKYSLMRAQGVGAQEDSGGKAEGDFCGSLQWIHPKYWMEERGGERLGWEFPPLVIQNLGTRPGLSLLVGPPRSGKTTVWLSWLKNLSEKNRAIFYIFSDHLEGEPRSQESSLCFFKTSQLMEVLGGAPVPDYLFIDSSRGLSLLRDLPSSVLLGSRVVMTTVGDQILEVLKGLQESSEPGEVLRVFSHLRLALGLRLIPGLDQLLVPVFEMLFGTQEVLQLVRKGKWEEVYSLMGGGVCSGSVSASTVSGLPPSKSGMRSLNQGLFHLVLKRKLDFRLGFEESPYPDELDGMLKSVGF